MKRYTYKIELRTVGMTRNNLSEYPYATLKGVKQKLELGRKQWGKEVRLQSFARLTQKNLLSQHRNSELIGLIFENDGGHTNIWVTCVDNKPENTMSFEQQYEYARGA